MKKVRIKWTQEDKENPSPIYGEFTVGGTAYCVYLRWKWEDPWTAVLVRNSTKENFSTLPNDWERLTIGRYGLDESRALREEIEQVINERFSD